MHYRLALAAVLVLSAAWADTLTLRNGRTVSGSYLGGNSRQIRMAVGDNIETYDVTEVSSLQFDSAATKAQNTSQAPIAPAAAPAQSATPQTENRELLRPGGTAVSTAASPAAASPASGMEIPAGTSVVVRMIDDVDSDVTRPGQTFRASVDEPVIVNGQTVIPRGADVVTRLVEIKDPNRLSGGGQLTLDLDSINVNGRVMNVQSETVSMAGESKTKDSAKVIGGTAALGAIIGAIAGGGKGAAIGAASGAGAGTAIRVMTSGSRVRIPPETRLTFTLQQAAKL